MRKDIYVAGYEDHDQLEPADSLAGRLGDDPLDAGYSMPDREPVTARARRRYDGDHESLDDRLAEEDPDVDPEALDAIADEFYYQYLGPDPRSGRLVQTGDDLEAEDVGPAGWAASAEEAAVHVIAP